MHRSFAPRPIRLKRVVIAQDSFGLALSLFIALIYFKQHSMVYHPRPYGARYAQALPTNGEEISYTLPFGNKRRFIFLPAITSNCPAGFGLRFAAMARWPWIGRQSLPAIQILMMRSCSSIIPAMENARAMPASRACERSTDAALNMLAKRLALSEDELEPATLRHWPFPWLRRCDRFRKRVIASSELSRFRRSPLCARRRPAYHRWSAIIFADRELR